MKVESPYSQGNSDGIRTAYSCPALVFAGDKIANPIPKNMKLATMRSDQISADIQRSLEYEDPIGTIQICPASLFEFLKGASFIVRIMNR